MRHHSCVAVLLSVNTNPDNPSHSQHSLHSIKHTSTSKCMDLDLFKCVPALMDAQINFHRYSASAPHKTSVFLDSDAQICPLPSDSSSAAGEFPSYTELLPNCSVELMIKQMFQQALLQLCWECSP